MVGKNDNGIITGIKNAKKLLQDIPNKVRDIIGILVDVNLHCDQDKEYLEIVVEPYPYPVSYKGEYHYRSGSTKQQLKGAALDKFLLHKQGKRWDGVPIPKVNVQDLDNYTFDLFKRKAKKSGRVDEDILQESNDILVENLQLKDGDYLKRAAILLFHNNPQKYVSGAYIKIGFFKTDDDLIFQDEIHGSLLRQADQALDLLLTKYLKAYISYEDVTRVEKYPFPKVALREALFNAIVHKDYSKGVPIQISVYDDKVIFWNNGQLPDNWKIEELKQKHPSNPFNPDIANAFFRAGLIEAWGRGVHKIMNECQKQNLPLPEYQFQFSGLMINFKRKQDHITRNDTKKTISLTANQKKIIQEMRKNPKISALALSSCIGISARKIESNIRKLKKNKIIT